MVSSTIRIIVNEMIDQLSAFFALAVFLLGEISVRANREMMKEI